MDKKSLRKQILATRGALSPATVVEKSQRIIEQLTQWAHYQRAQTIMTYLDFRQEVQTGSLVEQALQGGKRVVVPVVVDPKAGTMLASELQAYPEDLQAGAYGIFEPKVLRPISPEELDLIVLPGVAFDGLGHRLGYGGGYYDRFLAQTPTVTPLVALAFELQLLPDLSPLVEVHDRRVHTIITENRVIQCQKTSI